MPLPNIRTTEDEAMHREMERQSLDWCMVYNPTDEDFTIEWLPWKHVVPSKNKDIGFGPGKREVQRYLARWYCEHMTVHIVNMKGQKEAERILQERAEKGQPQLTKFEEQKAVWEKLPKTNDEKELLALYPILFLGVTREFGMDYVPQQAYEANTKTPQEIALEKLQNKKYTETSKPIMQAKRPIAKPASNLPSVDELESLMPTSKEQLAKEVSNE